jgi:hypothetical protein
MAPFFSSLGDGSGLKGSKPPGGISYARAGTHAGESFMLMQWCKNGDEQLEDESVPTIYC